MTYITWLAMVTIADTASLFECVPAIAEVTTAFQIAIGEKHRVLLLVGLDPSGHLGEHIGTVIVECDASEALCFTLRFDPPTQTMVM